MESGNGVNSGLIDKTAHQKMEEGVEGTEQCRTCQRFMKLGAANFCLTVESDAMNMAEIVGWIPGQCDHYLEVSSPF